MRAFALAVLVAFLVAGAGFLTLTSLQKDSWDAYTTESARVGEGAHNLVTTETSSHPVEK